MTNPSILAMLDEERGIVDPSVVVGGADMNSPFMYIAGPMSGIEDFNFPEFSRVAKHLRKQGYNVYNPAEADYEKERMEYAKATNHVHEDRDFYWNCMRRNLRILLRDECVIVLALPGWEKSEGACEEVRMARLVGIQVYELIDDNTMVYFDG